MTTSEPTTGELISNLRRLANVRDALKVIGDGDMLNIADRLESQEQKIADRDAQIEAQGNEMVRRDTVIKELTARAEKAERERDAAIKEIRDVTGCMTCKSEYLRICDEPCKSCTNGSKWTWRGLPQDGEGK